MALALRDRAAAGKGTPGNRRARALDAMGGRISRPPLGISRRKCFSPCWTEDGWALLRRWRALFAEVTRAVPDSAAKKSGGRARDAPACARLSVGVPASDFNECCIPGRLITAQATERSNRSHRPAWAFQPRVVLHTQNIQQTHALLRVQCRRSEPSHVQTHCIITHHLARIA